MGTEAQDMLHSLLPEAAAEEEDPTQSYVPRALRLPPVWSVHCALGPSKRVLLSGKVPAL